MEELVLDLGCGTSLQILNFVKETLSDTWIVGIDWDPYFCKISRNKARENEVNAEYLRCDAAFLPFKGEVFDVIYMLDSLRCLTGHSLLWFIKEAHKKLKWGGKLCITGLDRVTYQENILPSIKSDSLPYNKEVFIPVDGGSPFTSVKLVDNENYRSKGTFNENMLSELLWRCGMEPETKWNNKHEEKYTFYNYVTYAMK